MLADSRSTVYWRYESKRYRRCPCWAEGGELVAENVTRQYKFQMRHYMSPRQVLFLLRGGLINWMKERLSDSPESRGA